MDHSLQTSRDVVITGRQFLESPRWHDGRLWVSDILGQEVLSWAPAEAEPRVELALPDDRPSGIGFLPDGRTIVVSVRKKLVVDVADGSEVADLTALAVGGANEMIVDDSGRAWVGSFGYDVFAGEDRKPGSVLTFTTTTSPTVVAGDLLFPNGMVHRDDTLLVAETSGRRITALTVTDDGSLVDRAVWAELDDRPDGICSDPDGGVWAALPRSGRAIRLDEQGTVTHEVQVREGWEAVATLVGGDDGRTLFVTTSQTVDKTTSSAVETFALPA